jgi:hypothetical protein
MSLLDKASLIVTPNAYEESKLYSVVPNTTLGDMGVVRATTATRVNSAGLIEVVPRNLAQYSEAFDNGYWGKFNATITANNTTSPTGTSTADKIVENTVNSFHSMDSTFSSGTGIYTASIYAKVGERRYLRLNITEITPAIDHTALFDLQTGTLLSSGTGVTASIINAGNGWYRIILTSPALVGGQVRMAVLMQTTTSSTPQQYLGDGTSGLYLWGAQLEQGTTATEYFPTTTRLNIPRIDYTNGSCPSLLVEPQRTNALTYSNDYSNVSWGKVGVTAVLGTQVNPEGIASTYSISNTTLGDSYLQKQGLSTTAGNYTMSVFVKNVDNVVSSQLMAVHLTQGSVTSQFTYTWATNTFALTGTNAISGSSVLLSNGWVRLSFTYSIGAGVVNHWARLYANNNLTITKSVLVYGFQNEAGSYATSYIPTVASTVTRNADVISKTGISSLIGTEFTMFFDGFESMGGASSRYLILKGASTTYNNYISIEGLSGNRIGFYIYNNVGALVFAASSGAFTNGQRIKLAARCKNNDFAVYLNGVLLGSQASGTVPTTSNLYLGYYTDYTDNYNKINSATIFNTALTNTELAQLTTL